MDCDVHRMPRGRQKLHDDYGLWICHCNRGLVSQNRFAGRFRYFEYYSLSHLYEGGGDYRRPSVGSQAMAAGDAILMAPRVVHWYGAGESAYREDSVCFAGPVADALLKCGVVASGIIAMGRARRLLPIMELASNPGRDAQINANAALQALLVELYNENRRNRAEKEPHPIAELLSEIRKNARKWWTVSEMAEFCSLSQAQFRRVFRAYTGVLPKLYVDQLKVRQIGERLTSGSEPVTRIAAEFGYRDPFHFSRRFKDLTGFSPKRYRQQFR